MQLKMVQTQLLTVTEEAERLKPMLREKRDLLSAAKQALRTAQVQCFLLGCCAHEQGWGDCLCGEAEGLLGWDYCRERDFFGGGGVIVEIIRLHGEGEELLGWDYCGEGGVTEVGLLWRGYCGDYVTEGREGATVKREGLLWRGRGLLWRGRGYCGDF